MPHEKGSYTTPAGLTLTMKADPGRREVRDYLQGNGLAARVLLVEDDPVSAAVLQEQLAEACPGVVTHHVPTLEEALAALDQDWSVVLLDLGLPGMDRLEALQRLRAQDQTSAVIVITAQEDGALAFEALEEEAQDYLQKAEISPDTLARAIRYAIGRQQNLVRMRQVAAEALAQERNLLELIRRSADGIVIFGPNGEVSFANAAAEAMFGASSAAGLGDALPPIDLECEQAEIEVPGEDGPRLLDVRVVPVQWQGEAAHMALTRDVTERRRAEELRAQLHRSERLAAIGKLAAGIAHEINNPLTYVMGSLEMLQRESSRIEGVSPTRAERLATLCDSAIEGTERVVNIVRDLSVFSRRDDPDEKGRPTDVQAAFESALKMVHPQIQHRARIERHFRDVDLVVAHPGRLTQVMVNLLVNAAQAIEEGNVERNLIQASIWQEGDRVFARLTDTGCGIDASALDRLFEPFFTTKAAGVGTGLGLYVCRNILESYGGDIHVQSEFGKGAQVTVELLAWTGPAQAVDPHKAHFSSETPARARVLVIDDEALIRRLLVEMLSPVHDVVAAGSGREAQALLGHDREFDVVLCDMVMDDVSGSQLEAWMRERAPELLDRLVFMSGGDVDHLRAGVPPDGVDRLLPKPFRRRDVLQRVDAMLSR